MDVGSARRMEYWTLVTVIWPESETVAMLFGVSSSFTGTVGSVKHNRNEVTRSIHHKTELPDLKNMC